MNRSSGDESHNGSSREITDYIGVTNMRRRERYQREDRDTQVGNNE